MLVTSALEGWFDLLATPALAFEYEAVLFRSTHLADAASREAAEALLDAVLNRLTHVVIGYRYRPQLVDPGDEHVLEAAINGGAEAIITFNTRHFLPAATRFSIQVLTPGAMMKLGGTLWPMS